MNFNNNRKFQKEHEIPPENVFVGGWTLVTKNLKIILNNSGNYFFKSWKDCIYTLKKPGVLLTSMQIMHVVVSHMKYFLVLGNGVKFGS